MEASDVIKILSGLAQESRLAVFRLLIAQGPEGMPAGRIAESLGVPANTLSFHLKGLSHAGLVSSRQQGRFVFYSANYPAMNELIGYLTENCCAGEACEVAPCPPTSC